MNNIENLYCNGEYLRQNYETARQWYQYAAIRGNEDTMFNMGWIYHHVKPNYEKAMIWYKIAARRGHANSMCNIDVMYFYGGYKTQDYRKALKWYKKAARNNYNNAIYNIWRIYHRGETASVINSRDKCLNYSYKKAMMCYLKAAKAGSSSTMNQIGFMCLSGDGVKCNYAKAMMWFLKASDKDCSNNMYDIILADQVKQELEKAKRQQVHKVVENGWTRTIHWFKLAAEKGNRDSMFNISCMYRDGKSVDKDNEIAMD
ncbi:hypothetical protein RMATCC62417_11703 [Rhizopus microsporus]|nr:hypothetical protein RMATCC62417_11703 [Rhizopus microsporus]